MAKFIYRMQNILNVKTKLEEQEKMAFSKAQGELAEEERRLERLHIEKEEYVQEWRSALNASLTILEIKRLEMAVDTKDFHIREQNKAVDAAKKRAEAARVRLTEAMKERKIQDKLREKSFDRFLLDIEKEERSVIDELVSYTFGKNVEHD